MNRLDELYPKVRQYLRDNPKVDFNIETLAEEMEADVRDVQALVDMGYLDRDTDRRVDSETANRQKLAKEFEDSLKQMKNASSVREGAKNAASYGQQRYGDKDRKR
ncbi:MAG: hypothetical protein LBJ22_03735 [Synergistaceae bacterium]|nr:hypothetical protein [Synergistaceae bacterium]